MKREIKAANFGVAMQIRECSKMAQLAGKCATHTRRTASDPLTWLIVTHFWGIRRSLAPRIFR